MENDNATSPPAKTLAVADESDGRGRDCWDKAEIIAKIVAAFAAGIIPFLVYFVGEKVEQTFKEREHSAQQFQLEQDRRLRTFQVAVDILRQEPRKHPETSALRKWATTRVVAFSGEAVLKESQRELEVRSLPSTRAFSSDFSEDFK